MWSPGARSRGDVRRTADRAAHVLSLGALMSVLGVGCGADPQAPIVRKSEGEACQVSTECSAGLRCLDGVCAAGGCRAASDCDGLLPAGCEAWTCLSGQCAPACYPDGGPISAPDAAPAPDVMTPGRDAAPVNDDAMPTGQDALPLPEDAMPADGGMPPDDSGTAPDATDPADAGPMDAPAPVTDGGSDAACAPTPRAPVAGDLLVNEILADPGDDLATGDANQDGVRDSGDDEFVELANISSSTLQLSGVVVADSTALRHRFAARTLSCGEVVVVFAGGNTAHANWQSNWVVASTGALLLNNSGDQVRVGTSTAALGNLVTETYGSSAGNNQSIVRNPELGSGAPFVQHTAHPQSGGRPFSPGVRASGQPF